MWTNKDRQWMFAAHQLAQKAVGRVSPDPLVGAVLVKNGKILASGYHAAVATPHAETWAIRKAGPTAKGSTLYINLEPCCHYGNNPPCTDLIIKTGIKEVVASMQDPNALVNGQGFKTLIKAGIKVRIGLMEKEARQMNEVFIKYITTKRPFVVLKEAMTLDGKIATRTGKSRWVAGKESQKFSHHLRNWYDAILVGVGTILIDNPKLTTRLVPKIKHPIRIVLDAYARTPLKAQILDTREARTIIVVGKRAPLEKIGAFKKKGAEILILKDQKGLVDFRQLVKELGAMGITSLIVEGGGEVAASALFAGVVDKAHFVFAPKIFGGRTAKTGVEGKGVDLPSQAIQLNNTEIQRLGEDILVTGYF